MILNNIEKPKQFHIDNLKSINFKLTYNQEKWRLQKIREEKFNKDNDLLKDISKIKFENNLNLENLSFFYKTTSIIDPEKSNKSEK